MIVANHLIDFYWTLKTTTIHHSVADMLAGFTATSVIEGGIQELGKLIQFGVNKSYYSIR